MPTDVLITPGSGTIEFVDVGGSNSVVIDGNAADTIAFKTTVSGSTILSVVDTLTPGQGALNPGVTGLALGTNSLRWDIFARTLDVSGYVRNMVGGPSGHNLIPISADAWRSSTGFWTLLAGQAATITVADEISGNPIPGGKAHQFVNASAGATYIIDQLIQIDPNRTYQGRVWAARTAGAGTFTAGYIAYDKDLTPLTGNSAGGSYGGFITLNSVPSATGTWSEGLIQGEGTGTQQFPTGTRYIRPLITVNSNVGGTMLVAGFHISDVMSEYTNNTYRITTGGTTRMYFTSLGTIGVGKVAGINNMLDVSGVVNSDTGFRISNAAATGALLRGNGTNFVSGNLTAGDAISGGGANRVLYQNSSSNLATNANFTYDGSNTVTVNSTINLANANATTSLIQSATSSAQNILSVKGVTNNQLTTFRILPTGTPSPNGVSFEFSSSDTANNNRFLYVNSSTSGHTFAADTGGSATFRQIAFRVGTGDWAGLSDSMRLVANQRVEFPGTGSTAGLLIGGDATLFRSGINVLATSSNFEVRSSSELRLQNGTNTFYSGFRDIGSTQSFVYGMPTVAPTSGQVLSAAAPAAGVSTLTWVTPGGSIGGSTGATQGSVLFAGASGVLAQNNANFFWDNTNVRLGLGTTTPTARLSVVSTSTQDDSFNVSQLGYTAFRVNDVGGIVVNYGGVSAAFHTSSASLGGADGAYTDITTTVNSGLTNVTNGGTQFNRIYLGFFDGLPRRIAISTNLGGTNGVGGTMQWEVWNGSAWTTTGVTGSNLTAASQAVTLPTTATSRTTINGVNAYWVRGIVATAYTTAPIARISAINFSNHDNMPWVGSGLFIGKPSLTTAALSTIQGQTSGAPVIGVVAGGVGLQDIFVAYQEAGGAVTFRVASDGAITANSGDSSFRSITLTGGAMNAASTLLMSNGARSLSAWGTAGVYLNSVGTTITDSSTAASGTVTDAAFNSLGGPTLAATNTGVTTTNAYTLYIANAPTAGTNQTITNPYALFVNAGNVRFNNGFYINYTPSALARVGIGHSQNADASYRVIDISATQASALAPNNSLRGMHVEAIANAGSNTVGQIFGILTRASVQQSGGAVTNVTGGQFQVLFETTGTSCSFATGGIFSSTINQTATTATITENRAGVFDTSHNTSATAAITSNYGFIVNSRAPAGTGGVGITSNWGGRIFNPAAGGVITNNVGFQIDGQTRGTNNVGLLIGDHSAGGSTTYALQFASATSDRQGIWWGTDTNLYRSGADILRSDDTVNALSFVAGSATTGVTRTSVTDAIVQNFFGSESNPRYSLGRDVIASGVAGLAWANSASAIATGGAGVGSVNAVTRALGLYTSNSTALTERVRIDGSGNISFQSPSANALYWDGANARLGIGAGTSPANVVDIRAGDATLRLQATSTTAYSGINMHDAGGTLAASFQYANSGTAQANTFFFGTRKAGESVAIWTGGVNERVRIDGSGNISFQSPATNAFYWDATLAQVAINTTSAGTNPILLLRRDSQTAFHHGIILQNTTTVPTNVAAQVPPSIQFEGNAYSASAPAGNRVTRTRLISGAFGSDLARFSIDFSTDTGTPSWSSALTLAPGRLELSGAASACLFDMRDASGSLYSVNGSTSLSDVNFLNRLKFTEANGGVPLFDLNNVNLGAELHLYNGPFKITDNGVQQVELFNLNSGGTNLLGAGFYAPGPTFALVLYPFGSVAGTTSELRFQELSSNGSNYIAFKAPDAIAQDVTYTLPAAQPTANQVLTASTVTGTGPYAVGLGWTTPGGSIGGSTGATQGSVLFAGAAGVLAQDNANFFWDDANNRLGLGNTTPQHALDLRYGNNSTIRAVNLNLPSATEGAFLVLGQASSGTVSAGHRLGGVVLGGASSTNYSVNNSSASVSAFANQTWTFGTNQGTYLVFETTPNNSATRVERLRIGADGTIWAGNGETAASPTATTISTTQGSGTNIGGATLTIRAGAGTGTGTGGNINFDTADAGSTGSALNSYTTRMLITSAGAVIFGASGSATRVTISTSNLQRFFISGESNARISLGPNVLASNQAALLFNNDASTQTEAQGAVGIASPATRVLAFYTSNGTAVTERMRIHSDGVFYVGNGASAASPAAATVSATAGSGSNIAGASLTIRGGQSTGTGAGGSIVFSTSPAGTTGSSANAYVDRMSIDSTGLVNLTRTGLLLTPITAIQLLNNTATTSTGGQTIQSSPGLEFTGKSWDASIDSFTRMRFSTHAPAPLGTATVLKLQSSLDTGTPSWQDEVYFVRPGTGGSGGIQLAGTNHQFGWVNSPSQIRTDSSAIYIEAFSSLQFDCTDATATMFSVGQIGNYFTTGNMDMVGLFVESASSNPFDLFQLRFSTTEILTAGRYGSASNPFALRLKPFGATAGNTSELHFLELVANGSNFVSFKAPDSIANNVTYVLPSAQPSLNQILAATAITGTGPYTVTLGWANDQTGAGGGITSLNLQTGSTQTFANDTNVTITSNTNVHTLGWTGTLAVARGGTGTGTAFTTGSVVFAGGSGVYTQDNSNFFWDDTNNRLGLGNATPQHALDLRYGNNSPIRAVNLATTSTTGGSMVVLAQSNVGTVSAGHRLGGLLLGGASGANYATNHSSASITAFANQTWTFGSVQGTYLSFETTPDGSTTRAERLRIGADGTVWVGNGETAASPANGTISATQGSGTDIAGANLTLRSGAGTGTGTGGTILFQVAAAGSSGSALNSYTTQFIVSSGAVFVGTAGAGVGRLRLVTNQIQSFNGAEANARWTVSTGALGAGVGALIFNNDANTLTSDAGGVALGTVSGQSRTLGLYTSNSTALTERMRIDGSGNVALASGATNTLTWTASTGQLTLQATGTAIRIQDSGGNLQSAIAADGAFVFDGGLGLQFRAADGTNTMRVVNAGAFADSASSAFFQMGTGGGSHAIFTARFGATMGRFGINADNTIFADGSYLSIPVPTAQFEVRSTVTNSKVVMVVAGTASQSGNLAEFYRASTLVTRIDSTGAIELRSGLAMRFNNPANTKSSSLAAGAQSVVINYTLPITAPLSNQVLRAGTVSGTDPLTVPLEWATVGGSGTVTSITAGTGLVASPSSPITTAGTLSVDMDYMATQMIAYSIALG